MGDTARFATVSVAGRSSPVRSARFTAQDTVTATEPPGAKSVVSTETVRCAHVMCWELSAEAAVCCALDVAVSGLRAIGAAQAACAATPSTSMRASGQSAESDDEEQQEDEERGQDHELGGGRTRARCASVGGPGLMAPARQS